MLVKYIKRLVLKEWLPVIAVFSLVSLILFVIYCATIDFFPQRYYSKHIFDFVYLSIPMSIFAVVLPFFVYSYRFKLQSCDTYYQLPFGPKKLKNTRLYTGLVTLLAVYTTVFVIGFLIVTIAYAFTPETKYIYTTFYDSNHGQYVTGYQLIYRLIFNPLLLFVTYLIGLAGLAGLYFQSCFFVSLTNSILSAVVLIFCAQVFMTLFSSVTIGKIVDSNSSLFSSTFILLSPSLIGVNGGIQTFSFSYVLDPSDFKFDFQIPGYPFLVAYVSYAVNAVIFSAFGAYVILENDPSGENAGKPATRKPALDFIIYASAIVEISAMLKVGLYSSQWFLSVITSIIYFAYRYLIICLFYQTPKIQKHHYFINVGLAIVFAMSMMLSIR
jgi:hypothetical protein